jgi:hypothetical protein
MFRILLLAALTGGVFLQAKEPSPSFPQPLRFEPNRGQMSAQVLWIAHGPGYEAALSEDKLVLLIRAGRDQPANNFEMKLPGSHPWTHITGLEPTGGVSNYIADRPDKKALNGIPHYARLRVADVYDGIDFVLYQNAGSFEYDFVVHPGADPNKIRLAFAGQRSVKLDDHSGDLVVTTATGFQVRQARPHVYQQQGNKRMTVEGAYQLKEGNEAVLRLGAYDRRQTLVIDPTLTMVATLEHTSVSGMAIDAAGNSYITGGAGSTLQVTDNSEYKECDHSWYGFCIAADSFISKFNPAGQLVFSTYTGVGTGDAIAVDSTGIYITGLDIPAYDSTHLPGGNNLFVLKLNPDGSYGYVAYYTGPSDDWGHAIALDSQHNVWVAGATQALNGIGGKKVLIEKISPQGKTLITKIIGGTGNDVAYGIAVDHADNPWITGQTCSANFPASPGFNNLRGKCGIFVLGLNNQSPQAPVKWASVFGGGNSDAGYGIAVNANNEVYLSGVTESQVFPVQTGAYQPYPSGPYSQAFVTKLDTLGHFIYSTYLGSNGDTAAKSIALSSSNEVYIAGTTQATTFPGNGPITPPAGFFSKFSPDLSEILYSRQIGVQAQSITVAEDIPAVTPAKVYVAGETDRNSGVSYVDRLTDDYYLSRLRNFWITDRYINTESGSAQVSQIGPGWWSAEWDFEQQPAVPGDPGGAKVFVIRNRWHSDQLLNIAAGHIQSTPVPPTLLSARWTLEPIAGHPNVYRIRNVFVPADCLNIESGTLQASPVEPGWWSSWWTVERVF